jgi:release factor glutamine methyltransferase
MRIRDALQQARALGVDRLDAQLMLAGLFERPRAWLVAHDEAELAPDQIARLSEQLRRRAAGEPLAYVTGRAEFRRMDLQVSPAVLVPRPETELLVEWALELLPADRRDEVVDLGTGSGAIALALQRERPLAHLTATDASAGALEVARANAARHAPSVAFAQGDWWGAVEGRRFALAVSNPPYIAGHDPHLAALGHEPRSALTPEGDGMAALRRIVDGAPAHMQPGAWLLLEHGHDQGDFVRQLLAERGFVATSTRADLAALPRCSGAQWPSAN